jgi:hypothetical protein
MEEDRDVGDTGKKHAAILGAALFARSVSWPVLIPTGLVIAERNPFQFILVWQASSGA